jgi:PDZ domain-containing secreted protein
MKKNFTFLIVTFLCLTVFSDVLTAQNAENDKIIVVKIRSVNPDGSKNTTTLMKSGEDAQNFDVQKYIDEQKKARPDATVEVIDKKMRHSDDKEQVRIRHSSNGAHIDNNMTWTGVKSNSDKGFLGVSELSAFEKLAEGVRISVTRNSGAAKAGLKDDDVILQLNKTPINSFRDISAFMRSTKAGDKVDIVYDRDGKTKTTSATLGKQQDAWAQDVEQEKEACLGVYTSSTVKEGQRGAIINDFTQVSAAKDAAMQIGDVITAVNGMRVKTHQDVWDEIAKYKPKEVVRIAYLNGGETKQIRATLNACKPRDENVIVVPKVLEDAQKVNTPTNAGRLELTNFAASPNPTKDMVNISFKGEAVPTNVSFIDVTGKVLFQQNINNFNGEYNQRFDVSEYAKGIVVVKVQQGDNVFSKQIVVN